MIKTKTMYVITYYVGVGNMREDFAEKYLEDFAEELTKKEYVENQLTLFEYVFIPVKETYNTRKEIDVIQLEYEDKTIAKKKR